MAVLKKVKNSVICSDLQKLTKTGINYIKSKPLHKFMHGSQNVSIRWEMSFYVKNRPWP